MILAVLLAPALAQDGGYDAYGFHLAAFDGDLRDPLTLPRAGRFEGGSWFAGAVLSLADAPLVRVTRDPDGGVLTAEPLLDDLFTANLSLGGAPWKRLRLDVALPVHLHSTGLDGSNGARVGDLRATATLALLRPSERGGSGVAVVPWVDLPTGDTARWLGDAGVGGGGLVATTYEGGPVTLSADLGAGARSAQDGVTGVGGPYLLGGLAMAGLVGERVGLSAEYRQELALVVDGPGSAWSGDLLGTARTRLGAGGHVLVGGALGLGEGPGTAGWRVFLGGGYAPAEAVVTRLSDPDGDGVAGTADQCPEDAEVRNGLRDTDGCPDALGTLVLRVTRDGEPVPGAVLTVADRDGRVVEGVATPLEVPDVLPGSEWTARTAADACWKGERRFTASEGRTEVVVELLPTFDAAAEVVVRDDRGVLVPDATVRWEATGAGCVPMAERGPGRHAVGSGRHLLVVSAPGHRTERIPVEIPAGQTATIEVTLARARVRVAVDRIELMDKVYFGYDSARIEPSSLPVLDEVAAVLLARPELGRVEIGGHTDADGPEGYNLHLSQLRVEAVRAYLISRGVPAERLVARGYGESAPIDTNLTERGRSHNRRVDFLLLGP